MLRYEQRGGMYMDIINNCYIYDFEEVSINSLSLNINEISNNTENTWQPTRGINEINKNTMQGKIAETAFETFFNNNSAPFKIIIPYDKIRTDNYKYHAPFDELIYDASEIDEDKFDKLLDCIRNEANTNQYGHLSEKLRQELTNNNILLVEVKSTAVNYRKKNTIPPFSSYKNTDDVIKLLNNICEDDFLTYLHYTRKGNLTWEEYCEKFKYKDYRLKNLTGDELYEATRQLEIKNMSNIFVRVYVDHECKKVIILGYITREELMKNPQTKKMILKNKSENALYIAKSLKTRHNIKEIV